MTFTVSHPLIAASGQVTLGRALAGSVAVTLPSLSPYAGVADISLRGHAVVNTKFLRQAGRTSISTQGTISVTGGMASAVALIGDHATFNLTGGLHGRDIAVDKFEINGSMLHAAAAGGEKNGVVDFGWKARLVNLSNLASATAGTIAAHGHVHGPLNDLSATAHATAQVTTAGLPQETLTASLQAHGIPSAPSGQLDAQGRLAGAPLVLAAEVSRQSDGTLNFLLNRLQWKSASGSGALRLAPGTTVPLGHMQFRMAHLDEIAPLTGLKVAGSVNATLATLQVQGKPEARVRADIRHLTFDGDSVDRLGIDARVANPVTHPVVTAAMRVNGIRRGAFTGDARLTANGPLGSLRLDASSNLQTPHGPATLSATATAALSE
ncbi:MAG: hypothetical protein ACRELF_23290, partial [Gemmataceae bacterium]